jgi:hypothetical protein
MSVQFEVLGDTQVISELDDFSARERAAVVKAMKGLGLRLQTIVVDQNLAGAVLNRRTGTLARAQVLTEVDAEEEISESVGFNKATAPYGVAHEFGVPHEWIIAAVRAKALRFEIGGKVIFRKSVTHPPLPERSFLRSALAQIAPDVQPTVEAALAAAKAGP